LKSANILADGPSIELVREEDFLEGPVIAINLSIRLLAQGIPISIWAAVDHPDLLWEWAKDYLILNPKIEFFVVDNHIGAWNEVVDCTRLYSMKTPFLGEIRQQDGKRTLLPTLHTLLAWLWQQEYEHVRIFGADMRGSGSQGHFAEGGEWPNGMQWTPVEDEGYRQRWIVERIALAECMRLYRSKGWRVERFHISYKT
jgi:hypothetical protein